MFELYDIGQFRQLIEGQLGHFPQVPHVEFEGSTISIPINGAVGNRMKKEVVDFNAFMRLELERPVRNQLDRRQFEFRIAVWEIYGQSQLLSDITEQDAFITFSLALPKEKQPKSICFANQRGPDFPATIIYSACYDVYLNDRKIIDGQMGIALATPIIAIPPRNVLVAFEKPFDDDRLGVSFARGWCSGMQTISQEDFLQGANRARSYRGWDALEDPHASFLGAEPQ